MDCFFDVCISVTGGALGDVTLNCNVLIGGDELNIDKVIEESRRTNASCFDSNIKVVSVTEVSNGYASIWTSERLNIFNKRGE